jgi:glycosyltransferase involved in cell wall biosynthesis
MTKMRIGIDARLIEWPGIGRYVQELTKHLLQLPGKETYILYFGSDAQRQRYGSSHPRATNICCHVSPFSIREQAYWRRQLQQDKVTLFHAPHYASPLLTKCPLIVTIHDMVGFRYPEALYSTAARYYYQWMTRLSVNKARHIITDSHFTQSELETFLRVNKSKITPIPLGVDSSFAAPQRHLAQVRAKYQLPEQYLLYLGTYKHWKNVPTLLKAIHHLKETGRPLTLLLAGKAAKHQENITAQIKHLQLQQNVIELGPVDEEDIAALYQAASAFLFLSFYEGFGLPLLEAMAAGVPVIAAKAASLPEIVGDAGLLVDAYDTHALAATLCRLLDDKQLQINLSRRGRERAQHFSWRRCAESTQRLYQQTKN